MKPDREHGLDITRFSVPKSGNSPRENEDAVRFRLGSGRFAVADGATESSYSRLWARLVAESFVSAPARSGMPNLTKARRKWSASLADLDLPWYAQEKLERGAFATLIGLDLEQATGVWTAHAVGDSCLFHINSSGSVAAFPIDSAVAFDTHPALIWSLAGAAVRDTPETTVRSGSMVAGDLLVLATDAIAAYLVEQCVESNGNATEVLGLALSSSARRRRLLRKRESGEIHDDDLTFLVIQAR